MRIAIESFRGEAPRVTPRELPENAAQAAINARLQSGDLESWRQFSLTKTLANDASVETIYLLNDQWLSWEGDVDVARGAIPGDNTFRVYLTGPDVYDQPRFTNYALATTGPEPFPVTTRPLGVPAPDSQPTLESGVSTAPTSTTIEVIDSGGELTESWTTNPPVSSAFTRAIVSEDAGNAAPGYLLTFAENVGQPAYMYRDFGVGDSQVVFFSCDVFFGPAPRQRMFIDLLASATGAGIGVVWTEAGSFQIGIMGGFSSTGFSALAGVNPGAPVLLTWYTVTAQIVRNAAGTKTVVATLYQGSVQLATVTVTNAFTNDGGNFGFVGEVSEPTSPDLQTYYDNILIRGTSPTAGLQQTATSYVYTFVNDLGEESAPSPPSATVLKDDGTAITVTTATSVPSGFSVDYGVTAKRIYRAVSGATGTVFAFVAEIPLSQAEYVDELTDAELGDPLETELYALPPDDLQGLLALPNGVMAGFRRNQLCLSVQNRPHAWPVEWRLNTDTDVVCIGNIDTTVVIGTKAFPYLAIGNDPAAYSMTKLEVPQACVAKRSVAYLTGIGVVFASPDGLVAISGNGKVSNLTEPIFTRRQWQDLVPESIRGVAHDDVYHFWYDTEVVPPGEDPFVFNITPFDLALEDNVDYAAGPATTSAAAVPLNEWTLIELRRDSTGLIELLANGVVRASHAAYTANVANGSRPYTIGSFSGAQEFFIGYIDRVRAIESGVTKISVDFDGPDGSTTFVDNAGSALTRTGSVAQSDDQSYDGDFSALFPGGSSIASDRNAAAGIGTFSLSAAVYPTAYIPTTGGRVVSAQNVISIDPVFALRVSPIGRLVGLLRDPSGLNQLVLTSSSAVVGPLATLDASRTINIEISPTPTGVPEGMTVTLEWDGMNGTTKISGTPQFAGTYNISVTYVNSDTDEVVGTSTHEVVIT